MEGMRRIIEVILFIFANVSKNSFTWCLKYVMVDNIMNGYLKSENT